jgi:hypothetical protein
VVSPCQILPLFQVSVDVTVSLLVGTLKLVMIAELGVSAADLRAGARPDRLPL